MSAQARVKVAPQLDAPALGSIVASAYRVEALLGSGGMGTILRATELSSDRKVAIKVMTAAAAADPEQVARFRREAKAVSSLTSKHVVRVLDFGELDSGAPYLVMEHLEGTTLADVVKEHGALPVAKAVEYVLQAIHGIAEAHTLGIVHRDLKPANLFVVEHAGASTVKVLDFGASKLTAESPIETDDPGGVTVASSLIGSPRYMAPEQIRSALEVDARADIYGLGATLHELLSGKQIFFADSLARVFAQVLWDAPEPLSESRDDVPDALAAIVARCLAKAPGDRFASVEALAAALAPFGASGEALSLSLPPAAPAAPLAPPAPPTPSGLRSALVPLPRTSGVAPVRKPISAARAAVVLRSSTVRMARVRMSSEAPKRTMKIAAFALAARLTPGIVAIPSPLADAVARSARTARMVRFEVPRAAVMRSSRARRSSRTLAIVSLIVLLFALVAAVTVARSARHRASAGSSAARTNGS
ncbi:MAG: Serine/threonine-protein kinase pkn3 [Myxococcaceae bacterium]|nr:Serine/threonine-protein kinase pkn3 [Myxococcaceae bacterium]